MSGTHNRKRSHSQIELRQPPRAIERWLWLTNAPLYHDKPLPPLPPLSDRGTEERRYGILPSPPVSPREHSQQAELTSLYGSADNNELDRCLDRFSIHSKNSIVDFDAIAVVSELESGVKRVSSLMDHNGSGSILDRFPLPPKEFNTAPAKLTRTISQKVKRAGFVGNPSDILSLAAGKREVTPSTMKWPSSLEKEFDQEGTMNGTSLYSSEV